ncbi:3-phenylpropionate/cinnamic acid dioxygenase subunit beta [Alkalihalobacillus sp. MEB130]|uniref:3-phenylpropionate/cinnamic acid dioxygenase subunit beta n=1 Tax=Alkalihalobacillus sp. MEB130 TaxID=2976704 RepID=UPI0028DD4FFF|nr:3-phenylpropionate/cinnamic acid dioxygenase subunit beta [Alkalihalobacillus sp. MEB130]MDT8859703.1 3-phenylpropionate/cinnamic acid dioxygenase subunit beta [Alkalihalobacillus sp. MEB130]
MSNEVKAQVSLEVKDQITNLLYQEAYYLDNRMYKEWLELLSDDLEYKMPLRETVEGVNIDNISVDSAFYEETKASLRTRVNRLYTKSAWVENPATRQRHFISNIVVEAGDNPDEFKVRSYFLYKRSRGSTIDLEEMFGQRNDIVKKIDGDWKVCSRTIIPDQAVITTMNMSMFL